MQLGSLITAALVTMTRTTTSPTLLVVVTLLLGWKSLAVEDQPHLRRPSNQHHHGVTEEEHTTTTTTTTSDKNRRPATLTLDPHNLHWSSASNGHILLQGVPFHVRGMYEEDNGEKGKWFGGREDVACLA